MQTMARDHLADHPSARPGLIMFDWDGVLADTGDQFRETFLAACARCGFHDLDDPGLLMRLFDGNMYASLESLGVGRGRIEKILDHFRRATLERADAIRLFDGVPAVLRALAGRHTLAVVTSNLSAVVAAVLTRERIAGVDRVLGVEADTSKVRKIRRTMAAFPGFPAFYVGDTKGDMIEGNSAGARTVAVSWGWHRPEKLEEGRPDYRVHSPAGLLTLFLEGGDGGARPDGP